MLRGGHKGTKALPTIACHLAFTQSAEINRAPQVSSLYERRRQSARVLRGEFLIPDLNSSRPSVDTSPIRMIDIHSHILPGLDDGAGSMEEAIEMLRMAAAAGTTDIVADRK